VTTDPYDDDFLDAVALAVRQLELRPASDILAEVRSLVQRTMIAMLPNGSWPSAHLVQDALRAYVEVVENALASDAFPDDVLSPEDRRWLTATRQCVESVELLEDVLADLRADISQRGPNW
jgi:hypothetical protein